jgi:hypothetical protein
VYIRNRVMGIGIGDSSMGDWGAWLKYRAIEQEENRSASSKSMLKCSLGEAQQKMARFGGPKLNMSNMSDTDGSTTTNITESSILDCKRHQTMYGRSFGSPTKKLMKHVGAGLKATLSVTPSSTKRSTPQKLKLAVKRLLIDNKDLIVPNESTWSNQVDNKRARGTNIKKHPGANRLQKTGHRSNTEVAVHQANWKTLLCTMYLNATTRNPNGEDETYKYAPHDALGGLLMHARFYNIENKAFIQDSCFVVIALPSTGLDGPVITLTSDEVCGGEKLVHLLGLSVTDMQDEPLIPVCGTVSIECLSGQSSTPICSTILQTSLVWCMHNKVVFSVVLVPHSMANDNEITGWLSVNGPLEMQYHHDILLPAHVADATTTSICDLLPMAIPLPFNHGLPVGYAISGKATAAHAIKAWSVFAGEGDNSHEWLDTPFFHTWAKMMSSGGKNIALCWGQSNTYNREPPGSQGAWLLAAAALSCF